MKAFEVLINDHRLCLAGVGAQGVLYATVMWVGGGLSEGEAFLTVAGRDGTADEQLRWESPSLGVGAEVLVRVVETAAADPPSQRHRTEPSAPAEEYREHLREWCERLNEDERFTDEERRRLFCEAVADLEREQAELTTAPDPAA